MRISDDLAAMEPAACARLTLRFKTPSALLELDDRAYRAFAPLVAGCSLAALTAHLQQLGHAPAEIDHFLDWILQAELLVAENVA